jgi:Domain of unknown function (DUF4340)
MLTRFHKTLIAALAVQIVLIVVMALRSGEPGAVQEHPLLPDFDAAKVTKLSISGAEGAPVVLARHGTDWVLASAFDYPVDAARVTELLSPIAKLAAAEPVATQASRHKQLKVDDTEFDRKLVITTDKDLVLFIGAPIGHRTAVRIGGDDRVYGVSGLSATAAGTQPRDWTEPAYVKIPRAEVARVAIQRDATSLEIARAATSWSVSMGGAPLALATGETLESTVIDRLVDDLAAIDLAAPADPKRDASKPTAVITIERTAPAPAAGSGSASPLPGPPPPPIVLDVIADGEQYWVHQRNLPTAVMVDKARLDTVMTVDRDKLVKKPPPAAGSGSGSAKSPPPPLDLPPQ